MKRLTHIRRRQRGTSLLIVLVLLSVMLLGGMTMARLSETSTLVAGNMTNTDLSVQASEIGINTAVANLAAVANYEVDTTDGSGKVWYQAKMLTSDAVDQPSSFWSSRPEVTVGKGGQFSVRYFVERLCEVTPVTDPQSQCLLRRKPADVVGATGDPEPNPPAYRQYRITVRVEAPKNGVTFFQSVATR
jgi:hypothetical protein